ncbi:MAG: hypothetical protein WEB78_12425, partial [Ilumatobacteraceae bacterium]
SVPPPTAPTPELKNPSRSLAGAPPSGQYAPVAGQRAVAAALKKFEGQNGLLFNVCWPITARHVPATTERVMCVARLTRGILRSQTVVTRSRLSRRRPFFQPLPPGDYTLLLTSEGRRNRRDESVGSSPLNEISL